MNIRKMRLWEENYCYEEMRKIRESLRKNINRGLKNVNHVVVNTNKFS